MATINTKLELRLAWYARWLLAVATVLAKHTPLRFPRGVVPFVVNRSWSMRVGYGPRDWVPIRIDKTGRILK